MRTNHSTAKVSSMMMTPATQTRTRATAFSSARIFAVDSVKRKRWTQRARAYSLSPLILTETYASMIQHMHFANHMYIYLLMHVCCVRSLFLCSLVIICIQRALHVLVSMFWLLDCVFNCRNIAKMTLFSMQINRPSVGHSKWNPFSISVNASVLIVFRFNFIQQDFHRILSCVCVCVLFGTSLLYSVWRLFQYAAQHSFNVCNTMCTILHTPFPFFYLVVLLFFFRVLVFVLFSSTRSHLYWSVCFKAHHMHTHTRARPLKFVRIQKRFPT